MDLSPSRIRGHLRSAALGLAATAAMAGAMAAPPTGEALAKRYGCLGCHAAAARLVGPAYREVAARYAAQPDALAHLTDSIRNGGSGRWGDMAMPPQPEVSEADARQLADWIAGLAR